MLIAMVLESSSNVTGELFQQYREVARAKINANLEMPTSGLVAYYVTALTSHVSPRLQLINHCYSSRTDSAPRAPVCPRRNRFQH